MVSGAVESGLSGTMDPQITSQTVWKLNFLCRKRFITRFIARLDLHSWCTFTKLSVKKRYTLCLVTLILLHSKCTSVLNTTFSATKTQNIPQQKKCAGAGGTHATSFCVTRDTFARCVPTAITSLPRARCQTGHFLSFRFEHQDPCPRAPPLVRSELSNF